jgi:small-conductance mechanosensitive channel
MRQYPSLTGLISISITTTLLTVGLTSLPGQANPFSQLNLQVNESWLQVLKDTAVGLLWAGIATIALQKIIQIVNQLFPKVSAHVDSWRNTRIPTIRFQMLEVISSNRLTDILLTIINLIRYTAIFALANLYVLAVLSFFPATRELGSSLYNYIFSAIVGAVSSFLGYLPNLLTLIIIYFATYFGIQFIRRVFVEVDRGAIIIPGLHRDIARPTYNLAVFFIIALALAIAIPYLPGSDSPAFQGVSIFLGVLLSLGSTAAVANVISGIILIYTRAFQLGDYIRIGEQFGKVVEKTLLVTRLLNFNNIVVTIPNAKVLEESIENYSRGVQDGNNTPMALELLIKLSYKVSWQKAYDVLLSAAAATKFIRTDPAPEVIQLSLNENNVTYKVSVYLEDPGRLEDAQSHLIQNIRDYCREAGIELMVPQTVQLLRSELPNSIPAQF